MKGLHYNIYGEGTPIVFLHGFLGNSTIWKDFVEHFSRNFSVITFDLPGHGKSPIEQETIEMTEAANLIHAILQTEKIAPVHLIGHSMGGYVSLSYANLFPEKVKSITLFNSTAKSDNEQKKADRLKAARIFDLNPSIFIDEAINNLFYAPNLEKFPKEVKELTSLAKATSVKGAQASLRGMRLREDWVNWLNEQSFPVHYIAGKHDNTVPYDTILDQLPERAILTTLENSGHMGFVEEKETCLRAIESFLTL